MDSLIIKSILNYQFGSKVGDKILESYENIQLEKSRKTHRIKRIFINNKLFGSIEPSTGYIIITKYGGEILQKFLEFPKYRVVVNEEAEDYILKGKSVFSKFIVNIDENILSRDIVLIVNRYDKLLAIGETLLSAKEIKDFKYGLAVKIKHV
ncbi:tRNA-guanine(15) transglycosylase [Nanobdella aerobiophila]|uniref:tRNA-guanine(15) transglycosylase n=1 Tax=Nanobdella aerobiophila TaxID=2586965 RepID=A0A915SFH3_9ARCH|nr:PUA domain-containing protein [Nanobdella aerobiophila]BBL45404.1 tRNA-guanine(15) transglycosylase [Nanobdella aerobiophila]